MVGLFPPITGVTGRIPLGSDRLYIRLPAEMQAADIRTDAIPGSHREEDAGQDLHRFCALPEIV